MATGMLGDLFSPKYKDLAAEEAAEEQRLQYQAQDPFRAMAHAAYTGGSMAGKGLGTAVAAAAGRDPRTPGQRNLQAVEAAKQQVAALGFNPDDPKSIDQFYKQVISILQKQGLAAEAMAVAKEWNAQKLGDDKLRLENDKLARQRANDLRVDQRAAERNAILKAKLGAAASPVGKLWADMERATDPTQREYLKKAIENATAQKWEAVDLGDRVQLRNKATGEVIDTEDKGLPPKDELKDGDKKAAAASAYGEYLAGLQRQYNAAVELHNHPGLEGITGKWGRWVGEEGASPMLGHAASMLSGKDAGAALALYKQVTGGAFLAGLAKLKQASPNKSSGLGAVSEKEGDKVQSDAAALDRLQQAPDFRRQLGTYIREMEGFAARLATGAQQDGVTPIPLQAKPLVAPKGGRRAPAAPAAAPTAAPTAPAGGDRVRVRAPDGQTGTIERSKLEAAKARGYTEIQ